MSRRRKTRAPAGTGLRHVVSINDLDNAELETIFVRAEDLLKKLGGKDDKHAIRKSTDIAQGRILASIFFEPSTRTRLSFESAMIRLGGSVITSADPATSSAAKGESLADTVRVASNYSDIIVLRHPRDGAARYAAEFADVPVINAGDGGHEHPTQTLCDVFTLRRDRKTLKGMNVAISGDLRGSRTIHSFVYALARLKANLLLMPAKGMELPAHVDARLREEFDLTLAPRDMHDASVDALYVTAKEPHQLALYSEAQIRQSAEPALNRVDAVYVTRFQKERWKGGAQDYPKIDRKFLDAPKFRDARVMHPLPRVEELDIDLDADHRAAYFRQAAYGVPVRMALIALLLGLDDRIHLTRYPAGFKDGVDPLYRRPGDTGLRCANPNCIVHDPHEGQRTENKFNVIMRGGAPVLRCFYCETDIRDFVFASKHRKRIFGEAVPASLLPEHIADLIAFTSAGEALEAGFHPAQPLPGRPRKKASG